VVSEGRQSTARTTTVVAGRTVNYRLAISADTSEGVSDNRGQCVIFSSTLYEIQNTDLIFTALHGMQTRSSNENSVRPSVRPSVKRMNCDKTEKISPYFYTIGKII